MFHGLQTQFRGALIERVTLAVNHVLMSEAAAVQRLQPHTGRSILLQVSDWPGMLPMPAPVAWRVTAAGLLEWCPEGSEAPDLRVTVDGSNPALGLFGTVSGRRPKIEIAGDAAFATDLHWLMDNVRWDVEDDLARVVGVGPAHQIARVGRGFATALRGAVQTVDAMVRSGRGGVDDPHSR